MTNFTNCQSSYASHITSIKSIDHSSSSHAKSKYHNLTQDIDMQNVASSSTMERTHLLPDLNELPLLQGWCLN